MTPNNTPKKHRASQTLRRTAPLIPDYTLKRTCVCLFQLFAAYPNTHAYIHSQSETELPASPPLKKTRVKPDQEPQRPTDDDKVRDRIKFILANAPCHKNHEFKPEANEIIPRLYISDVVTANTPSTLNDLNITHVVSVMLEADIPKVSMSSLVIQPKRYNLPILDRPSAELYASLDDVVKFIKQAMDDPEARVLCHCYAGASRSTSVVVAYLVSSQSMDVDEALALVKSKRKISQPNSGFVAQVRSWHSDRTAVTETDKE